MASPQERLMALINGTSPVDFARSIDPSTLHGKTTIVTGGASGIGLGIAEALASHGAKVGILDISAEAGERVASVMKEKGHEVLFVKTDVSNWDEQAAGFKKVLQWAGGEGLDVVVAAAGIQATDMRKAIIADVDGDGEPPKPVSKVLDVNFTGVWWTTNLALFYFNKFHRAKTSETSFHSQLLLVSSLAGYAPPPFDADYAAAKHGVRGLWKSIRTPDASMAQYQANLLAPGWTHTGMTDGYLHKLIGRGIKVATVADNVRVALRCIVDQTVSARAVCCAANPEGVEDGQRRSGVFDICDDVGTLGIGKPMLQKLGEGVFDNYMA